MSPATKAGTKAVASRATGIGNRSSRTGKAAAPSARRSPSATVKKGSTKGRVQAGSASANAKRTGQGAARPPAKAAGGAPASPGSARRTVPAGSRRAPAARSAKQSPGRTAATAATSEAAKKANASKRTETRGKTTQTPKSDARTGRTARPVKAQAAKRRAPKIPAKPAGGATGKPARSQSERPAGLGAAHVAGNGSAPATAAPRAPKAAPGPYAADDKFLAEQRRLLDGERAVYEAQALDLRAEAESLAQEREPGDVQFDEESGEGGTVTVDRERDLALSAQALAAVEEIDAALTRIADRTYGACERCRQPIPKPRLKALPFARLCVACKSGGLSRR